MVPAVQAERLEVVELAAVQVQVVHLVQVLLYQD